MTNRQGVESAPTGIQSIPSSVKASRRTSAVKVSLVGKAVASTTRHIIPTGLGKSTLILTIPLRQHQHQKLPYNKTPSLVNIRQPELPVYPFQQIGQRCGHHHHRTATSSTQQLSPSTVRKALSIESSRLSKLLVTGVLSL